jgi:hypothetical protein
LLSSVVVKPGSSTAAYYTIEDGPTSATRNQIGTFTINQVTHRGAAVTIPNIHVTSPSMEIRLHDRGVRTTSPAPLLGLGAIRTTCTG